MALIGWVDTVKLGDEWADAPADEQQIADLANAALWQCRAYAPALPEGPLPADQAAAYAMAQTLQIKHLWAREKAGNGVGYGAEGYMVNTYPLVLEARSLLRPKRSPLAGLL